MNGAESLVRTLVASGVELCFANPGTSEMHFVAALDRTEGIRCVLALFEGVATGAADGYYRVAGKPASTLLHLGPGLANGLANLHNARKARSGVVNVVGEHALAHIALDAPLTSDLEGIARTMSDWVKTSASSRAVAGDGAEAVARSRDGAGRIATLILPADTAWGAADRVAPPLPVAQRGEEPADVVATAARVLGRDSVLLLGGAALRGQSLVDAGRIAAKTGCRLLAEHLNARVERGAGRVPVQRLPYAIDAACALLAGARHIVLAGAAPPVAFFAYPNKPGVLSPPGCEIVRLSDVDGDIEAALDALCAALDARTTPAKLTPQRPHDRVSPTGPITQAGIGHVLGMHIPDHAIIVDESVTTGRLLGSGTDDARPHDWMNTMGGSIGFGLPAALGAALAAPDRRVIALEGDGSAMYTLQALWSMAREATKVTILLFANRSYAVLEGELAAMGAGPPGERARGMLSLENPTLSWVQMASAMGVEAGRAQTLEELSVQLDRALRCEGPYLVEVGL